MRAAGLKDIDPQAVEPQLAVQMESAVDSEARDVAVELADEIAEAWIALRQIVERGVAGVSPVAVIARPSASGAILGGEIAARLVQFREQRVVVQRVLVEAGGEK